MVRAIFMKSNKRNLPKNKRMSLNKRIKQLNLKENKNISQLIWRKLSSIKNGSMQRETNLIRQNKMLLNKKLKR